MGIGAWQLVLVLVIVFVLFGAGKLPRVMGDFGKGVKNLKDGLKGKSEDDAEKVKPISKKESADLASGTIIDVEPDEDAAATKKKKASSTAKKKSTTTAATKRKVAKKKPATASKKAATKKKITTKKS